MSTFIRTTIVFFILTLASKAALADWKSSFYTDDSEYYLKLTQDGFRQLIRIHQNDCHQVNNITITTTEQFQNQSPTPKVKSTRLRKLSDWHNVYGLNKQQHCFFELKVSNLNKNDFGFFTYAIKIIEKNGNQFYYQGLTDSILPQDRIKPMVEKWIYLGSFGSSLLEGNKGVFFKVWEPHAEKVYLNVAGQRHEMQSVSTKNLQNQFHYAYIDTASKETPYYYEFQKNGKIEVTEVANNNFSSIKVDPYAKKIDYKRKGGAENGYIKPLSLVSTNNDFSWRNDQSILNLTDLEYNNWIMYQLCR